MLEDCVQVFLVLLSPFALLLHLLLLFQFLSDPKKNKTFLLMFLLHLETDGVARAGISEGKSKDRDRIQCKKINMRMNVRCMNTLLP